MMTSILVNIHLANWLIVFDHAPDMQIQFRTLVKLGLQTLHGLKTHVVGLLQSDIKCNNNTPHTE